MINPLELFINPLSISMETSSPKVLEQAIKSFNYCFHYCKESISAENLIIYVDAHLYFTPVFESLLLKQALSNISRDERTLFYKHITKSKLLIIQDDNDSIDISISADDYESIYGKAHRKLCNENTRWFSFLGKKIFSEYQLNVNHVSRNAVHNHSNLDAFKKLLPIYEPNPKHRLEPYSINGEIVSPMTVSDEIASQLLIAAKGIHLDGDRWSYCRDRNLLIRFKRTYTDRCVYHGFECQKEDVPDSILQYFGLK